MSFKSYFILIITVLGLWFLFQCGNDKNDVHAFRAFIISKEHFKQIELLGEANDFLNFGYQNVVDSIQVDTLKKLGQHYLDYLAGFEPQYRSTRKLKDSFMLPVKNFLLDLNKLEERINAYRSLLAYPDSVQTNSRNTRIDAIEHKKHILLGSITSKFLIERTIILVNQMTVLLNEIERKP